MLGEEFVRTQGHYHANDFQELYTVLEGEGIFFFQKGKEKIEGVIVIQAKKGDWVLVPRGYAHITINPSKKELKIGQCLG